MPQNARVHHATGPRELHMKADRARELAWTAGDRLTYERLEAYAAELEAYAAELEAEASAFETGDLHPAIDRQPAAA
jgi:hypothetical protein